MCDTTEVSINDMQVKINMLVNELEKCKPYLHYMLSHSQKHKMTVADTFMLLARIEKLSQWSEH